VGLGEVEQDCRAFGDHCSVRQRQRGHLSKSVDIEQAFPRRAGFVEPGNVIEGERHASSHKRRLDQN
jgi:hypothetical protein